MEANGKEQLDGAIVVDKPGGWTSHDVVSKMRRIAKTKKVGHLGTLDPIATGVLPLVLSSGSGSEMRQAVGVAVFFGMLGVTLFGLIFTPIFYVIVRNLADRRAAEKPATAG